MNSAIGFASELVPLIKTGKKTLTYRYGDKYEFLKVGDEIDIKDSGTGEIFGRVKIIEMSNTTFDQLPIDRIGHEAYKNKKEQKQIFEKYYGEIKDNDKILILGFELLELY